MGRQRLQVQLASVTFQKGHDGFLRGRPEPVLLVAAYGVAHDAATLLGQTTVSPTVTRGFPCTVKYDTPPLLFEIDADDAGPGRLVLLALALEGDAGTDIQRLAVGLSQPEAWSVRSADSAMAAPFRLAELELFEPHEPPRAQPVRLTWRDVDVAQQCEADDWIGACLIVQGSQGMRRSLHGWDLNFVAEDGRNDWTAKIWMRSH